MYSIEFTKKYLADLKRAKNRKLNINDLNKVIKHLASSNKPLPNKYKDHKLTGKFIKYRECHINPDWLLIYKKDKQIKLLKLIRTGSHSDLF